MQIDPKNKEVISVMVLCLGHISEEEIIKPSMQLWFYVDLLFLVKWILVLNCYITKKYIVFSILTVHPGFPA